MKELIILGIIAIYIIKLILKHNLFVNHLKLKIKVIGLDIEIKTKEKDVPPTKEPTSKIL